MRLGGLLKKHLKYLSYVVRHKWFVFLAACRLGIPFCGLIHDLSKFLPSEWWPYCRYFYGGPHKPFADFSSGLKYEFDCWSISQEGIEHTFNYAWLFHQHRNHHHWQYWVLREDSGKTITIPIPKKYVLEMIADWIGAGRAITGKYEVKEWYASNADKMQLHLVTRYQVEKLLSNLRWIG